MAILKLAIMSDNLVERTTNLFNIVAEQLNDLKHDVKQAVYKRKPYGMDYLDYCDHYKQMSTR